MTLVTTAGARTELETLMRSQQFTLASGQETRVVFADYLERMKEVVGKLVEQNKRLETALTTSLQKEEETRVGYAGRVESLGNKATCLETRATYLQERLTLETEAANARILSEIEAKGIVVKRFTESCQVSAQKSEKALIDKLEAEARTAIAEAIKPVIKETETAFALKVKKKEQELTISHQTMIAKIIQEANPYLATRADGLKAYQKDMDFWAEFHGVRKEHANWEAERIGREVSEMLTPLIKILQEPFPGKGEI